MTSYYFVSWGVGREEKIVRERERERERDFAMT